VSGAVADRSVLLAVGGAMTGSTDLGSSRPYPLGGYVMRGPERAEDACESLDWVRWSWR